MKITQKSLHELFEYKDGKLFWKIDIRYIKCSKEVIGVEAGFSQNKGKYRCIKIHKKNYLAHRLIFLMHHGHLPRKVDHIDGDGNNNLIKNLRPATNPQNGYNSKLYKNNTTGFKGVVFNKKNKNFHARIRVGGNPSMHLGTFITAEEAYEAYKKAAIKYHGEFANFG